MMRVVRSLLLLGGVAAVALGAFLLAADIGQVGVGLAGVTVGLVTVVLAVGVEWD